MQVLGWDIFCQVIDNYGDAGVCWRLANDLAKSQQKVRLFIDKPQLLTWLAATNNPNIEIITWQSDMPLVTVRDVVIEAFGCNIDSYIIPSSMQKNNSLWLNLEYLTAQSYAQRSHQLLSPCMYGPLRGCNKYFFYPGFTTDTGGLLRETDLLIRQQQFNRHNWLQQQQIPYQQSQLLISLFCYEPVNLINLLEQLILSQQQYLLLITAGRSQQVFTQVWQQLKHKYSPKQLAQLSYFQLPFMNQQEFDYLLWSCHLNLVRGEDSLVRAIWAGKPFIWQIYPQQDGVHWDKLEAFLIMYLEQVTDIKWRNLITSWFYYWNSQQPQSCKLDVTSLFEPNWLTIAQQKSANLQQQSSLTENLMQFVAKKSVQ